MSLCLAECKVSIDILVFDIKVVCLVMFQDNVSVFPPLSDGIVSTRDIAGDCVRAVAQCRRMSLSSWASENRVSWNGQFNKQKSQKV